MRHVWAVPVVRGAALLLAAVLWSTPAPAQTHLSASPDVSSLEQLMGAEVRSVFGASRYLQRVIDAPSSVSIVTADEIERVRRLGAHVVTGGLELRGNTRQDQRLLNLEDNEILLDDRRDSFVWSLFAQDEITITPGWLINASVGFDHFPSFGGHGTYRGALIYKPASDRACKLIYGTAFRAPNAYERYYYSEPGHLDHLGARTRPHAGSGVGAVPVAVNGARASCSDHSPRTGERRGCG